MKKHKQSLQAKRLFAIPYRKGLEKSGPTKEGKRVPVALRLAAGPAAAEMSSEAQPSVRIPREVTESGTTTIYHTYPKNIVASTPTA